MADSIWQSESADLILYMRVNGGDGSQMLLWRPNDHSEIDIITSPLAIVFCLPHPLRRGNCRTEVGHDP